MRFKCTFAILAAWLSTYINATSLHQFKLLSFLTIYHIFDHIWSFICLLETVTCAFYFTFCCASSDKSQSGNQQRNDIGFVRRGLFKNVNIGWSLLWSSCSITGTSVHSFVGQLYSFCLKICIWSRQSLQNSQIWLHGWIVIGYSGCLQHFLQMALMHCYSTLVLAPFFPDGWIVQQWTNYKSFASPLGEWKLLCAGQSHGMYVCTKVKLTRLKCNTEHFWALLFDCRKKKTGPEYLG